MAFERELEVAKEAARKAGEVMGHYRENGFEVDRKDSYTDLVTEADHEAQEVIVETIQEEFPEDGFLAEENDLRPGGEDRVWVIDPVDGTTNFVHGFPYYGTSIALRTGGVSKVGAVYLPSLDEMFSAVEDGGATVNGKEIRVSDVEELRDSLLFIPLHDSSREELGKGLELVDDAIRNPASYRRPGAAAPDLCMVASGRADGIAMSSINPWDIAAGELIIREAGGSVRVQDSITDGYLETVASNGKIQEQLEEVFDRNVRDQDRS
ncbi:MAG: inositol monophosphatase [Candidatus Nanohaloarchaea archaeon]